MRANGEGPHRKLSADRQGRSARRSRNRTSAAAPKIVHGVGHLRAFNRNCDPDSAASLDSKFCIASIALVLTVTHLLRGGIKSFSASRDASGWSKAVAPTLSALAPDHVGRSHAFPAGRLSLTSQQRMAVQTEIVPWMREWFGGRAVVCRSQRQLGVQECVDSLQAAVFLFTVLVPDNRPRTPLIPVFHVDWYGKSRIRSGAYFTQEKAVAGSPCTHP